LIVGGTTPSRIASTEMISSTAADAPIMWPSIDFDELTGTRRAPSPKMRFRIRVSTTSFFGVLVPCAFT
jgi:hypothetical protein